MFSSLFVSLFAFNTPNKRTWNVRQFATGSVYLCIAAVWYGGFAWFHSFSPPCWCRRSDAHQSAIVNRFLCPDWVCVCVCVVRMWPVYLAEGLRFIKRISKTGRKAFDGWHAKHQSPPSMRSTLSVCVYAKAEASTFNPLPFRWHQSFVANANAKSFFIHSTFMYSE